MIKRKIFEKAISDFEKLKDRTNFLDIAFNLKKHGFETEGQLLILTTWNFASFRYVKKKFDIEELKEVMSDHEQDFQQLNSQTFRDIDLDKYGGSIKRIYADLSAIKGIGYTGAPKLMHLRYPELFVMWDTYISGAKPKRLYENLDAIENGYFSYKKYGNKSKDYLQFLRDMQGKFKDLDYKGNGKSLAKAIDEFNFMAISVPIQKIEKEEKQHKKITNQIR